MAMTENEKNKMAVLIDSENVSSKNIEFIMKESIRHGFLTIKRIYGDWTDSRMTSWKKVLPDYAIQPIQQFKNTSGKNFSVRVTDPVLLEKTGGIVQGMSGSPIIQNGHLIGAVTHVLVNDPTTGYGIFIENMLDAAA